MAHSANIYTGDGATTPFVVNFTLGFLSRDDVFVTVDGASTSFTWINDGLIDITPAPADQAEVSIRRIMDKTILQHDYVDGALLDEQSLDESNLQLLYIMHESLDGYIDAATLNIFANIDMKGFQITNLVTGDENSAATKGYVDGLEFGSTAKAWAETAEDVLVPASAGGNETDEYSAKHYAAKAEAADTGMQAIADAAEASATAAGVSETNAAASEALAATHVPFGCTVSTSAPSGGVDGDLWFVV